MENRASKFTDSEYFLNTITTMHLCIVVSHPNISFSSIEIWPNSYARVPRNKPLSRLQIKYIMNRSVRDQSHLTRSPQPLRSPSPDIVAANMIASTRTPTTEIPAIPNFRHNRQDIPLFEEIDRLRREN